MTIRNLMTSTAVFVAETGTGSAPVPATGTESTDSPAPTGNAALAILTDTKKVESINEAMNNREAFATFADAYAKLESAHAATDGFHGLPIAIKGQNPETGEVDESIYAGANAVLAYVGGRVELPGATKGSTGIKSIVIFPAPTLDSFLGTDDGKAYAAKVLEKELALVFFRGIRGANTLNEFQNGVASGPASVADYLTEHARTGSSLDTATFDKLWSGFRINLKKQNPALAALLPAKGEVIKSIRSVSYAVGASDDTKALESKNVFGWIANVLIAAAATYIDPKTKTAAPLDSDTIKNWVAGRTELVLDLPKAPDAKDFSVLDAMAGLFGAAATTDDTAA